jgi:predicted RNA-binding protein with TRAM domain
MSFQEKQQKSNKSVQIQPVQTSSKKIISNGKSGSKKIKVGDTCILKISAIGPKGIGIDEYSYSYSVFVPNSILGQIIKAKIIKINLKEGNYAVAQIVETIKKPKHKVELLDEGDQVRVQLDKPIDISGKKLTGNFRSSDIRWSPEIHKIKYIIQKPDQPILYLLDGNKMGKLKADSTAYTRNQLQPVSTNEKQHVETEKPIENEENRQEVQKILERKKIGKSFQYLIKWKGIRGPTWEKRKELIEDIPQLIERFDKKMDKTN